MVKLLKKTINLNQTPLNQLNSTPILDNLLSKSTPKSKQQKQLQQEQSAQSYSAHNIKVLLPLK